MTNAPTFVMVMGFVLWFLGVLWSIPGSDRREKEAAAKAAVERAANPPEIETYQLSDGQSAPFSISGMHDRVTGCDYLIVTHKGRVAVTPRTTRSGKDHCGWTMNGDPRKEPEA